MGNTNKLNVRIYGRQHSHSLGGAGTGRSEGTGGGGTGRSVVVSTDSIEP